MTSDRLWMVFDVESVGLHGEGFAVAWVIMYEDNTLLAQAMYSCDPNRAEGTLADRAWVAEHCRFGENVGSLARLHQFFWEAWELTKKRGGYLAADVTWPVEANFLSACIADDPDARAWNGPYPLIDIASIRLAAGFDPLDAGARRNDELPEHNPLADARQSARLLLEALWAIELKGASA